MSVHGTASAYRSGGCRCNDCREAHRMYTRARTVRWHAEVEAGTRKVNHGLVSTYNNYACRCDLCRAAHSVVEAAKRARRKQPT